MVDEEPKRLWIVRARSAISIGKRRSVVRGANAWSGREKVTAQIASLHKLSTPDGAWMLVIFLSGGDTTYHW